jgi:ABC-type nitrate/sulfonate/bicarbonate transport system permease component
VSRFGAPALFSLLVLTAWELGVRISGISPILLPSPSGIVQTLSQRWTLFAQHAWVTLIEILLGFALGGLVGLVLGVLFGYSRLLERAIYPWLVASQMVPIVAVAPILVLWFGFTLIPKVLVVALISFFPVAVNTIDGLRSVDPEMVDLMRTMGATRSQIIRHVRIPSSLPAVFSGLKVAMALSVVGAIFGEWVGSSEGLGYLMLAFNNQLATADLFAAILVLSLMGIALFFLVGSIQRFVIPWYQQGDRRERPDRER